MPSGVNLGSQGGVMQTMTKAADGGGMLSSLGGTLSSVGDKVKPAFDWMESTMPTKLSAKPCTRCAARS